MASGMAGITAGGQASMQAPMQAVVLAGGLATRMRPRTLTVPKAMLEVAGRPFVDWQLERLARCGVTNVVMCVAFLGDQIREHVGDGRALPRVRVALVRRGLDTPRHGRGHPRGSSAPVAHVPRHVRR